MDLIDGPLTPMLDLLYASGVDSSTRRQIIASVCQQGTDGVSFVARGLDDSDKHVRSTALQFARRFGPAAAQLAPQIRRLAEQGLLNQEQADATLAALSQWANA